ncbi:hypothetical protein NEFER03_1162 [Nematocida sp. LUAm3]|nr:hypothetical protein NEFER03_1162 [Nematocida sp. LUAm3]KAI5175771.1 hypothetical protein NEFER02_1640 [Nematocida sp. LUAm2]KAI5178267.1 hypothetical protein NEFER01_1434 [Nematocida sp. LUAm1]
MEKTVDKRKKAFQDALGGKPSTQLDETKREAVEKVFFFSEQQFNEVCEDLMEEIERRKAEKPSAVAFNQEFSLKRNTIREQMSFLEEKDLHSLIEDLLLVLNHKYPDSPEDRLVPLNQMVDGLQEIVASNVPHSSPSSKIKKTEEVRRKIEKEKDPLKKLEILTESLPQHMDQEKAEELNEFLILIRNALREERKEKEYNVIVTAELLCAMEALCKKEGRQEYMNRIEEHKKLQDEILQKHHLTKETINEFLIVHQNMLNYKEEADKSSLEAKAQKEEKPVHGPMPLCATSQTKSVDQSVDTAISEVIFLFEELEYDIEKKKDITILQKTIKALCEKKDSLISSFKASNYKTQEIERLPAYKPINSSTDAIEVVQKYYEALISCLP